MGPNVHVYPVWETIVAPPPPAKQRGETCVWVYIFSSESLHSVPRICYPLDANKVNVLPVHRLRREKVARGRMGDP